METEMDQEKVRECIKSVVKDEKRGIDKEIVKTGETMEIEENHLTEIRINAKGEFSGTVRCKGITPEESYKKTIELAKQLEDLIVTKNGL